MSEKEDATFWAVMQLVFLPALACVDGAVLKSLWGWFVVPTFGLPHLSLGMAIGLGLVAAHMTHLRGVIRKEESPSAAFFSPYWYQLALWLMGATVHYFAVVP